MPRLPKAPNDLQSIHPTLKAALGSLDVQLEEELARYRKQRRAVPVMAASRIGQPPSAPPLEVINLYLPSSTIPASVLPQAAETGSKSLSDSGDVPNPKLNSTSTPQLGAATGAKIGDDESKSNALATSDIQTPLIPPDDYLESSEQLLKSLTEEPKKPRNESPEDQEVASLADNLLTPLGMGSMLLLLLSSASIGYLLFNPALVQRLGLNRFFPIAAPVAISPSPTATTSPSIAPPAISPNLANGGLENLDKNSISNLKPSENSVRLPIPSVPSLPSPAAVVTPGKTNPAIVSGSPNLAGQLGIPPIATPLATPPSPAAAPPKPAPSPSAARPAPSPATSPTATNPRRDTYFYVVAAYDGDRSLAQARAVIPEAYLAEIPNQGTQIQMGAFLVEAEAKALIQELKQKGITASVYQPN